MRFILILLLTLSSISFSATPLFESTYKTCLIKSNQLNTPNDRDTEKLNCFNKFKKFLSLNSCTSLAGVLEYTQNKDKQLFSCIDLNRMNVNSCIDLSNKMIYAENNDALRWTCIQNLKNLRKQSECLKLAKNMRLPHNRITAVQYCENSSEIY
ncbi:MAG: hypothetical protein L6Q37_02875 [Bdellovibrionaceae bacterium]|nr:hypothetical protein [Pseudobdellovibrionaceae bacterium]